MRSVFVTGCNRGIGFGLVKKLAKIADGPETIFATCRDINKATVINCQNLKNAILILSLISFSQELKNLAQEVGNIEIIELGKVWYSLCQ